MMPNEQSPVRHAVFLRRVEPELRMARFYALMASPHRAPEKPVQRRCGSRAKHTPRWPDGAPGPPLAGCRPLWRRNSPSASKRPSQKGCRRAAGRGGRATTRIVSAAEAGRAAVMADSDQADGASIVSHVIAVWQLFYTTRQLVEIREETIPYKLLERSLMPARSHKHRSLNSGGLAGFHCDRPRPYNW